MLNIIVPVHRVQQVVTTLSDRWSETKDKPGKRPVKIFGRYIQEEEGMFGCYALFVVNGVAYIDSELYGKTNSEDDLMLVAQILGLQTKWGNGDFKEALQQKIKEWSS